MLALSQIQSNLELIEQKPIANYECEAAFLGAALLDPTIAPQYLDVPTQVFYLSEHQKVWEGILEVCRSGRPVDLTTTAVTLVDLGYADMRGTLANLLDGSFTPGNHDAYMELLMDKYRRRRVEEWKYKLGTIARDTNNQAWEQQAQTEFYELFQENTSVKGFTPAVDWFQKATQPIAAIPTGIEALDELWAGGFANGNLITIAGRPGMGKSAFACWLSLQLAHRGAGVAFASVEMSGEEVAQRWIASMLNLEYRSIRARGCSDPRVAGVQEYLSKLPLYLDDKSSTPAAIIAKTIALASQVKLGLLVVDHLHRMFPGSDPKTIDEANKSVTAFKNLARKLNIPVVLLCQLNRGVESRENKRPNASDVRQFANIEQESDLMVGLYRDEVYNENTVDRNITEILTMKNRHGPAFGTCKVLTEIGMCQYKPINSY